MSSTWGIILAAGLGVRLGSPKAFLQVAGKPLLLYPLQAFQKSDSIDKIGIACRKEDLETATNLCLSNSITKLGFVVPGGKERQDSVHEAIRALPPDADIVAIHDAARPLVPPGLIDAVVAAAREKGGAIPVIPVNDTVKIARDSRIIGTLKRSMLWCAQTPQAFHLDPFKRALEKASAENYYGTDDASLMENAGFPVFTVEGSQKNMKVTTRADLTLLEAILSLPEPIR